MKFYLPLFCSLITLMSFAQVDSSHSTSIQTDTIPKYVRLAYLPTFSIRLPDSSWFSRSQVSNKKPTLLLYFSPDCGHCMLETEEMISKMNCLKNIQIVMVTSREFEDMINFFNHYKLDRFKNIKIGRDGQRTISSFYNIKFTPFSALYSKQGKLLKAYEKGIDWPELLTLLNK